MPCYLCCYFEQTRLPWSLWQINYDNLCYLGYTLINRSREVIMQDQTPSIESAPLVHLPDPNAIVNIDEDGNFSFKSPDETSEPKPQEPEEYHDYLQKKINELIRKNQASDPLHADEQDFTITRMQNEQYRLNYEALVKRAKILYDISASDTQRQKYAALYKQRQTQGHWHQAVYFYELQEITKQIAALATPMYAGDVDPSYASNFVFALYVGLLFPDQQLLPKDLNQPEQVIDQLLEEATNTLRDQALQALPKTIFGKLKQELWATHCDLSRDFLQSILNGMINTANRSSRDASASLELFYQQLIQEKFDQYQRSASALSENERIEQSIEGIRLLTDFGLNLQSQQVLDAINQPGENISATLSQFYDSSKAMVRGLQKVLEPLDASKKAACARESDLMLHTINQSEKDAEGLHDPISVQAHIEKLTIMRHLISHDDVCNECADKLAFSQNLPSTDAPNWLESSYEYYSGLADVVMQSPDQKATLLDTIKSSVQKMLAFPSAKPEPKPAKLPRIDSAQHHATTKNKTWWHKFTERFSVKPKPLGNDQDPPAPPAAGS